LNCSNQYTATEHGTPRFRKYPAARRSPIVAAMLRAFWQVVISMSSLSLSGALIIGA
jgi:hypothetical protein